MTVKPPIDRALIGARGEEAATDYLRQRGYRLCGRNWRSQTLPNILLETKITPTEKHFSIYEKQKKILPQDTISLCQEVVIIYVNILHLWCCIVHNLPNCPWSSFSSLPLFKCHRKMRLTSPTLYHSFLLSIFLRYYKQPEGFRT